MKFMSHPEKGREQVCQRLFDLFDVVNVMVAHEHPGENVYSIKVCKSSVEQLRVARMKTMANVSYGDGHGREQKCCGCVPHAYDGQRGGVVQSIEVDGSSGGVQSDYGGIPAGGALVDRVCAMEG
jgi:hypothetical protein